MPIDTGKLAKKMGRTSPQEARSIDQDPLRVPPHKKPRLYRLTVKYTRTVTETLQKDFPNKASMQAFRAGVEREIAKQKAAQARRTNRYWGTWYQSANSYKMDGVEIARFDSGPDISESLLSQSE